MSNEEPTMHPLCPKVPAAPRVRRPVLTTLAALLVLALASAPVGAHHFEGQVSLWISELRMEGGADGIEFTAVLVERDVGSSVSGFGVTVSATSDAGRVVGPVELQESEQGIYQATIALAPGSWNILATSHQGDSALAALGSSHERRILIDSAGAVQVVGDDEGGSSTLLWAILAPGIAVVLALLLLVLIRRRRA